MQDQPERERVVTESAPCLPLLEQDLDERLLATQQLDQIVNEASDDECFVQVPDAVHVQTAFVEPQGEPALDGVNGGHDENPNHVLLHFRHVPVRQMEVHLPKTEDEGPAHHHAGRIPRRQVEISVRQGSVEDHGEAYEHCQQGAVRQVVAHSSEHPPGGLPIQTRVHLLEKLERSRKPPGWIIVGGHIRPGR